MTYFTGGEGKKIPTYMFIILLDCKNPCSKQDALYLRTRVRNMFHFSGEEPYKLHLYKVSFRIIIICNCVIYMLQCATLEIKYV